MLNNISKRGLELFGDNYICSDNTEFPDALLVRSKHIDILDIKSSVKVIARAGVGVDNIPVEECTKRGIAVFNTPGANSNSVKELVVLGILASSRNIFSASEWLQSIKDDKSLNKTIEQGKKMFLGNEIYGKNIGIIGFGAIGKLVALDAISLGMNVFVFDPFVDIGFLGSPDIRFVPSLEEIFSVSDFVSIHVPLNKSTAKMINYDVMKNAKKNLNLLNFSREEVVNVKDIHKIVEKKRIHSYVTDFPTNELMGIENIIVLPHLGASTLESEENCAKMAVREIKNFLEFGNVENSVNLPSVSIKLTRHVRICIIHISDSSVTHSICKVMSDNNVKLDSIQSKSNGKYAYTIIDTLKPIRISKKVLESIHGVIHVRIIKHNELS